MSKRTIAPRHAAKLQPCFRAELQANGTLELLVYEDIGYNYWTDGGVTAKTVKQQIDDAGTFERIVVRINSPGGDAFEGSAILSLLKAQKKPVAVYVDGIAASAASIIAMAGDTITMGRTAMMMVHNAWSYCMGNAQEMRKAADVLDKISAAMAQAYMARTGKTAEEVKAIMDADTWMDAEECVAEGFATDIATDGDDTAAMALARSFKALGKLGKLPAALAPKAEDDVEDSGTCGCPCAGCQDGDCQNCDCDGCGAEDCANDSCDCGGGVENSATVPAAEPSNLSQYEARLRLLEKV